MEINNITFRANYIDTVSIKKYNNWMKRYFHKDSSLVQIDFKNKNDKLSIGEICDNWRKAPFLKFMTNAGNMEKVYALTLQKKDFEKLESDKILGIVKLRDYYERDGNIEYLQVNPQYINVGENCMSRPIYKGCGKAILKSLQKIYDRICLVCIDDNGVEEFYKHNGFILEDGWCGLFMWEKSSASIKKPIQKFWEKINLIRQLLQ